VGADATIAIPDIREKSGTAYESAENQAASGNRS
jgi:hypothetical protein